MPNDTQADLTERARACFVGEITAWIDNVAAALQSEREAALMDGGEWRTKLAEQIGKTQAAAAEARRAAIEECAELLRRAAEISDPGWPTQQKFKVMIADTRALASPPAPQEET